MWERTKRAINSYVDDLINRLSGPDRDVREVTRGEMARLLELEAQTRASVKMLEKEVAETELRIIGVSERERIARERGDEAAAASAAREIVSLANHRDFLKQQIQEALSSAERARALREQRRVQGQDLANEIHMTRMREELAGLHKPFAADDPSATIEEMRARLNSRVGSDLDARVAEADRELRADQTRAEVDTILARYKQSITSGDDLTVATPQPPVESEDRSVTAETKKPAEEAEPEQPKSLGRNEGPLRPID
jgi:phage shock protein A